MAALSEGIQLAKKSDLDCDILHDVLCKGALSSPLVQVPSNSIDYCKQFIQGKGKALLNENFATNFPLKHQQKDLRLALQLSEEVHQQIPVISAANELYKTAVAKDHGDKDMCAVYTVLKN